MQRSLATLFVCSLSMAAIGSGLMPLLPVYALRLGVSTEVVSTLIAAAYVALALGSALAHRLAALAGGSSRALVTAGLVSAPLLGLIAQTRSLWQLAALFLGAWFLGGVAGALISTLVGLAADSAQRGRVFGLLWLRDPLGAIFGGALFAVTAEQIGLEAAFALAAGWAVLWPLLAAVGLRAPATSRPDPRVAREAPCEDEALPQPFTLLLLASTLAGIPVFAGRLGTTLAMQAQGYGPGAIGSTALVGGLLTIPLLPLSGLLADRLGRRAVTMLAYGLSALGLLTLAGAEVLWQFWVATALLGVGASVGGALTAALAADLLPAPLLAQGFGRLGVANWVAATIGSAAVGVGLAAVGATGLYLGGAGLGLAAMLLLGVGGGRRREALPLRSYERR